jgi:hypothetical protein
LERSGRAVGPIGDGGVDPLVDPAGEPSGLWTCPRCGHRFVSANLWHSCSRYTLDEAFARARPNVRACFDRFVELVERCGPVVVIAQKTRIALMVQVRFAGATVLRDRLRISFALGRRVEHPRLVKVETYGPRWIGHRLEVREPAELDDPAIAAWLCESYRDLGERASLRGRTARPQAPGD